MFINEEVISKIKELASIEQIVGEYVKLEKKGANYVGLCPFHNDQNPSMSVSPNKKLFKCFSCNAKGDVFGFLKDHLGIHFNRAVQMVGEKVGIKVDLSEASEFTQSYEKYYKILQSATTFYHFCLTNTIDGKNALEYLYKRKLNDEIIKRFKIGLSLAETDLLYKSLVNDKYQPLDMIESGVIRSSSQKKDTYFDVFRNRIMFPIEDLEGNVVGFSGRKYLLEDKGAHKDEPKYLNSSENTIFKKSNILYNYKEASLHIRRLDQVVLFEGFMDIIAAYKADIHHTVATMGTALTKEHITAIGKLTKNIVIYYDGDRPGIEATKKAIELFTKAEFNVKAVHMKEGLDPDDYVNRYGPNSFKELIDNPINSIDFLYETEKDSLINTDVFSIERFKNEVFKLLDLYKSNVITEIYLSKLATDLNISNESIIADYNKYSKIEKVIKEKVFNDNSSVDFIPNPDSLQGNFPWETEFSKVTKTKKIIKGHYNKYLLAENELIRQIYNSRELVKKAEVTLENEHVGKHSILFHLYSYYNKHEIMDLNILYGYFSEIEKKAFEEILNSNQDFSNLTIDELTKKVKSYSSEKAVKKNKDNTLEKDVPSVEDIADLLINKKAIVIKK